MKVKLSYELKQKILEMGEFISHESKSKTPSRSFNRKIWKIEFDLDLTEHKELLEECKKWTNHIQTYFKTSYTAIKAEVGPFSGVWPVYNSEGVVHFSADVYEVEKESWKDWFIVEDIKDAPQFIA